MVHQTTVRLQKETGEDCHSRKTVGEAEDDGDGDEAGEGGGSGGEGPGERVSGYGVTEMGGDEWSC